MDFVLSQFCICALGVDDAEGEKKAFSSCFSVGLVFSSQGARGHFLIFAMVLLTLVSNGRNSCCVVDTQFSVSQMSVHQLLSGTALEPHRLLMTWGNIFFFPKVKHILASCVCPLWSQISDL